MEAILYIGHGTRSKTGSKEATAFLNRIIGQVKVPIQEISFLELTEPSIETGFLRCVEKGAAVITVVPIFLLAAGHIKEDIPLELSRLSKKYPGIKINIRDPFGVQDTILDGIAELVRKTVADLNGDDSLLIVGRGSSDPEIHISFREIANGVRDRLKVKRVSVCYLAAAEPRFLKGIETISEQASGRVIVVPYLLFSGLLLNEINHEVEQRQKLGQQIIQTGPLSRHRSIEEMIINKTLDIPKS